jgi:hypothetical protein
MNIKLHLDRAEYEPIERTAKALGCEPEELVYHAVDEYMLRIGDFVHQCGAECRLKHTDMDTMRAAVQGGKLARKNNLPLWADSAGSVHNYEGMGPAIAEHSRKSRF